MKKDPRVAAAELGRPTSLGKIHWYRKDRASPDLCVSPPQLRLKVEKVRVVQNWSNHRYGLNAALVNPPVRYEDIDGFLRLLSPRAPMGFRGIVLCAFGVIYSRGSAHIPPTPHFIHPECDVLLVVLSGIGACLRNESAAWSIIFGR